MGISVRHMMKGHGNFGHRKFNFGGNISSKCDVSLYDLLFWRTLTKWRQMSDG